MEIQGSVVISENVEDTSKFDVLMCECGHPFFSHAVWTQYYYPDQIHHTHHSSQCIPCGVSQKGTEFICKRFRLVNHD